MADGSVLVEKVLEVAPLLGPAAQAQLIGFLPEVAAESDHPVRPPPRRARLYSCSFAVAAAPFLPPAAADAL